jgi:hypothetical protein
MSNKYTCFDCQHRFNLNTREPIMMVCCGKTACRHCVTTKMIKNKQNGQQGIAKKGEFDCSHCHSQCYSNIDIESPLPIQVNYIVKDMIALTLDNFQILCKDHPDVLAERYCSNHRALLCKDCTYEKHTDHLNTCHSLNQDGISRFF